MSVVVPAADEAAAAAVTQRLQEATTVRAHIGAWVARRRAGAPFTGGGVLVDFAIEAATPEEARARALAWAQAELARGGAIAGAGEPRDAGEPGG